MKMVVWVAGTLNQFLEEVFILKSKFSIKYNKAVSGKTPFCHRSILYCTFYLSQPFSRAVLHGNVAFSIVVVLSAKRWYFRKAFWFQKTFLRFRYWKHSESLMILKQKYTDPLTLSWRRSLSYRNQSIDLQSKSIDCFLYCKDAHREKVKLKAILKIPRTVFRETYVLSVDFKMISLRISVFQL